ncbi:MAG: methylmalonyl-CoA mutase family protein [Candidatus Binatus sp.]|uniref:acyl-CoA mutase large subunit family protein n=1 Tax=Candidatus Binatus sp. TaxID=2811406 RepID=UPI00272900EC|nr:methylmalonyl-CoA mutase family protein [Candidatus Binatus sp.]MDO8431495.1 methylmalonyl-CoA mutase family protein [Candidatus Binatus sp.]
MSEDDRKLSRKLSSARKNWEERKLGPSLKRGKERKPNFVTSSGIEIKRAYDPDDLNGFDFVNDLGFPGEYPFTRGVQPTMYRGRLWTMRQYAGFGTAEESNRRYRYLFEQGQTGLSVAFDLPTQMGRDSDHPLASGEVGRVGVSICSLADMETMLSELPLDKISTSMTINSTASILLALYLVAAERRGVSWDKVNGTIQNDVLKEYVARGTYIYPPRGSMRIITDIFSFASKEVPNWNTISISGYHIREAGSTAAQELAFTLADGIAYVDAAIKAGLEVDAFASRLSFFFNVHNNFFEEIAKFRAARRLWAKIMKERFGAKDERSMMMRFHAQTAGSTLTAQQVDNNVVRVTLQAMAAVLGGAQSLHTNSKDEALALPTENSVLLALRTQQVIAHESDVGNTVDPLGGSYYVERLTTELEQKATEYISRIDDLGGAVAAIERGYMQREIQNAAFIYQREIETKDRIIVGVNQFTGGGEPPGDILRVKPEVEEQQRRNVARVRAERDQQAAKAALARVEAVANNGENLMPSIIDAVRAWCTLGEISDAMRRVFGEYKPVITV